MVKYIIKSSGEQETFNSEKFQRSLRKAGTQQPLIEQLTKEVIANPTLTTTHDLYHFAYEQLKQKSPPVAARYNLKNALIELGPTGFPFERFVAEIFKRQGYTTELDKMIQGFCIPHEVDIVMHKQDKHIMVECKFHQERIKADVKIPLYIKARFEDILKSSQEKQEHLMHEAWIVTNTQFTNEAIQYGQCAGLTLIGWSYPAQNNLAHLIDLLGLQPITILTSLTHQQKRHLIKKGVVLCKDTMHYRHILQQMGLNTITINHVMYEAQEIGKLGAIN
jgi:hypothetical protein